MDKNLMWWFRAMPEIKRFESTWGSKDVLGWLFCTLPKKMPIKPQDKDESQYASSSFFGIKWMPQQRLQKKLEIVLKLDDLEELLRSFVKQCQDDSESFATQHLQAYLYKIAVIKARKWDREWQRTSWYKSLYDLWDISLEGFAIASKPTQFWANYDSKKGSARSYAFTRMESKIRDKVFKLCNLVDAEIKSEKASRYWILYHTSEKELKQALKDLDCTDLKLESRLVVWKCFMEVYVPVKNKKYEPPTKEQREKMAELYPILQSQSPELKQHNLKVDAKFIDRCLENSINALRQYLSRPKESSLDINVGSEDSKGITLVETIPDERENRKFEEVEMEEECFIKFYQKLDKKLRILVVFNSGCGLTTREIADMDASNWSFSTISRKLYDIKLLWSEEWYKKNRGDREPANSLEKVMKVPGKKKLVKELVDEIWKKNEPDFYLLIYPAFQKAWRQLESSSQEILELQIKRKPFKEKTPELSLNAAEKEKIADVFQVLVSGILQWLEVELEMSLASCEPLKKKVAQRVDECLILIYQENIY